MASEDKKNSFLGRKLEEMLLIKAIQNFSLKMMPYFDYMSLLADYESSIMAGDSPTSDYKDPVFALPPSAGGRSTPPPTTSYFSAKQENPAVATEIVPDLSRKDEIDGHKEQLEVLPEGANLGYKMDDGGGRRIDKDRDHGGHNDKETSKLNGYGDGLDGQWIPSNAVGKNLPKKEEDDEEDETCVVNCLYYTMQCCECTIS